MQIEFNNKIYIIDFKDAAKKAVEKTLAFVADNQQSILMSLPVVAAIIKFIHRARVEERLRRKELKSNNSIWDRRRMHMWDLKRPLNNRERRELDERMKRGEEMVYILESMRVLR